MAGHALLPKICRGLLLGGLPVRIVTAQAAEASRAAAIAIAKAHKQIVLEQIILRRRLAGEGHEKNAESVIQSCAGTKVAIVLTWLKDSCLAGLMTAHADIVHQPRREFGWIYNRVPRILRRKVRPNYRQVF